MKFFADQDIYLVTINYLKSLGYDILKASDVGLQRALDEEILRYAYEHQRVLITRDKGFGALVFLNYQKHSGVILLRIKPHTIDAVHQELADFLEEHAGFDLQEYFVVIEPGMYRIRQATE